MDLTGEVRKRFSQEAWGRKTSLRVSASIILIDRDRQFIMAVCDLWFRSWQTINRLFCSFFFPPFYLPFWCGMEDATMCSTPHWISEVVNFNSLSPTSSRTLTGDISQFFTVLVSLAIGLHDKLWEVNILSWKCALFNTVFLSKK